MPTERRTGSISTQLLQGIRVQDSRAWDRFVLTCGPLVYQWCRKKKVPAAEIPDVVQDVFRRVDRGLESFHRDRPNATFRGWLWTITRNVATDRLRVLNRQPTARGGSDHLLQMHHVAEFDASADIEQSESAESDRTLVISSVLTVIQKDFEPKTWDIFWRSSVLGHRTSEIAEEYQMTGRAVRQAKHRVMNRLREECLRHGIAVDETS